MRVKSRKPPAENLITSDCGDRLQVGGGADDVVGDQMRHVAGDGEHQVVVLGRHDLDIGAERLPERRAPSPTAAASVPSARRQDAPAVLEQLGEAGVGAGMLGAGDRVGRARNGRRPADAAPSPRTTAPLTEPTSETMAPGFSAGAISAATAPAGADRHAEDDEVGARARPRPRSSVTTSARPSSRARARTASAASVTTTVVASPVARGPPRAIDEPIRPMPIERDALEDAAAASAGAARTRPSAATTSRFASSAPMVMRSASGRP